MRSLADSGKAFGSLPKEFPKGVRTQPGQHRWPAFTALVLGSSQSEHVPLTWARLHLLILDGHYGAGFGTESFSVNQPLRGSRTPAATVSNSGVCFSVLKQSTTGTYEASGHHLVLASGMRGSFFVSQRLLQAVNAGTMALPSAGKVAVATIATVSRSALRPSDLPFRVDSLPVSFSVPFQDPLWDLLASYESEDACRAFPASVVARFSNNPALDLSVQDSMSASIYGLAAWKVEVASVESAPEYVGNCIRLNNRPDVYSVENPDVFLDETIRDFLIGVQCVGALVAQKGQRDSLWFFPLMHKFWDLVLANSSTIPSGILIQLSSHVDSCVGFELPNNHWVVIDPNIRVHECGCPDTQGHIVELARLEQGFVMFLFHGTDFLGAYGLPAEQLYSQSCGTKRRTVSESLSILKPKDFEEKRPRKG